MTINMAEKIIAFLSEFDLEYVSLIGGEPTCYPQLSEVIHTISSYGMKAVLITNGLALSNRQYLKELTSAGLYAVNLSMKGWSPESYIENTGVPAYEKKLVAIENVANSQLQSMTSFVISYDNVNHYLNALVDARKRGADYFYLSFEQDFSALDGKNTPQNLVKIFQMIDQFSEDYEKLSAISDDNFLLHQSYPLCIWNKEVIRKLIVKKQFSASCHLLERSGLVFATDGSLIPCNSMYQTPVAKFGIDFVNRQEFEVFGDSDRICEIYNKLSCLPDSECDTCKDMPYCGGGCIANWFHYNKEQIMNAYQAYKNAVWISQHGKRMP